MASLSLTLEELDALRSLKKSVASDFASKAVDSENTRKDIISSVSAFLLASSLGISLTEAGAMKRIKQARSVQSNAVNVLFAESMATAIVVGYYQFMNTDIARGPDWVAPEFGLDGLAKLFIPVIASCNASITSEEQVASALASGLNVSLRSCSADDYFGGDFYKTDIKTLSDLMKAKIDDGYNVDMLNIIGKYGDISTKLNAREQSVLRAYDILFEDGFGVVRFDGVLYNTGAAQSAKLNAGLCLPTIEATSASKIKGCFRTLETLAAKVSSKLGPVTVSDSRQFNFEEIFKSSKPVYFPYKILEYVGGRQSTFNTTLQNYRVIAEGNSWKSYRGAYVSPNVNGILRRGIYKAIEMVLRNNGTLNGEFISENFTSKWRSPEACADFLDDNVSTADLSAAFDLVDKLVVSMTTAYILTRWTTVNNNLATIRVRVCTNDTNFNTSTQCAEDLFIGVIDKNEKRELVRPIDLTAGADAVPQTIIEYQCDVDPKLAAAEPLFGYTVQLLNQAKRVSAGWSNILIGQSQSGKELYSGSDASNDIRLQRYLVHNIYAGSRAGKGVMTMNILANALAAGKPVFYLDRKPDMASMLYELSGGSQFIINGGAYDGSKDLNGYFSESGPALQIWNNYKNARPYLESHPEIAKLFESPGLKYTENNSFLADYIYFRAFIFCMGLIALRATNEVPSDIKAELNGSGGIVIVVDELTNVQNNIMRKLFSNWSSELCKEARKLGDADEVMQAIKSAEKSIKSAEAGLMDLQNAKNPSMKKESDLKDAIEAARGRIELLKSPVSVYAATIFDKICDSYTLAESAKNAGWREKEFTKSDIFVLGQTMDIGHYFASDGSGAMSSLFFPMKSDKKGFYAAYAGQGDIIRTILECMQSADWFFGRMTEGYAEHSSNEAVKKWLEAGNWEYICASASSPSGFGVNVMRGVNDESLKDASYRSILFKPYLVLNDYAESGPVMSAEEASALVAAAKESKSEADVDKDGWSMRGREQYVTQCRRRVEDTSRGLWDSIRVKHLKDPSMTAYGPESLNDGIGFKGLVRDTLMTLPENYGKTIDIDDHIQRVLARSGDVADKIAAAMGDYSCWQELIFDFSPNGLFSIKDMVNAVVNPELYAPKNRLRRFADLGLLSEIGVAEASADNPEDGDSIDSLFDSVVASDPTVQAPAQSSQPIQQPVQPSSAYDRQPETPRDAASQMQQARDLFFGGDSDDEDDEDYPDDSDFGYPDASDDYADEDLGGSDYAQPTVDIASILWSFACATADTAMAYETDYEFTEDDVDAIRRFAYSRIQHYYQNGEVTLDGI